MLENGFTSGCLTIISNDFQANYQSLLQSVEPLALKEWNRFDDWKIEFWLCDEKSNKFDTYYKLNKTEKKLFDSKANMPSSFIEKYYLVHLEQLPNVLHHKKNPNTQSELIKALTSRKVYEVKCNICNRTHYMDEESITCVKWLSCVGAACLSSTIKSEDDTHINLCKVNNQSNALQVLNTQLSTIESISNPLSYYGGYDALHISYISDIHLLHHLNDGISLNSLLNTSIRNLYETMDDEGPIVFGGDTSSNPELTIAFYTKFVHYKDYLSYKRKKRVLSNAKNKRASLDIDKQKLESKIARLKKFIEAIKDLLLPYLDFKKVEQYKKRYDSLNS